jgi:PTH2 family peptidyl-tRNA hydrolase
MTGDPRERERPVKQVIVIRRDLRMRRGKEIAQGAHAAMAWLTRRLVLRGGSASAELSAAERQWLTGSFRKVTVAVRSQEQLMAVYEKARAAGLVAELITDSGRTEFHGVPTATSLGIGPDYDDLIDPVTGDLELY